MKKNIILLILAFVSTAILGCGAATEDTQEITDTSAPVITLHGDAIVNLTTGDIYTEAGSTATDDVDTDLTTVIDGSVNTSSAGTYILTYTATDTAGNTVSVIRTVVVVNESINIEGDAYISHSDYSDSYYMEFWGDDWESGTSYTDSPSDTTYDKALELTKGTDWGTVIAWGNEVENALDISAYTHAKFKVKSDTFTAVEVTVLSASLVESKVTYNLSNGEDLGNSWVEMTVGLPATPTFTDMTWFSLNFIGDSGTVLVSDIYFTVVDIEVTGLSTAAPIPSQVSNDDVVVLYSDSFTPDGWVSVWNSNWWNAPTYSEGSVEGNAYTKYEITDGGVAGGTVGLEFGYEENGPLDASAKTVWNIDLYFEAGITKAELQLVSSDGSASYVIDQPATGQWIPFEILFSQMTASGVLTTSALEQVGLKLWGAAGKSVYLDNLYFSGQATFYDLSVTVTDENFSPILGANVTIGNLSATTNSAGIATLNVPEGDAKVTVNASGFGVATGTKVLAGADTNLSISVAPLNPGPSEPAAMPTANNSEAFVLYSDALSVDKYISFWSDDWWHAPTFSEVIINSDNIAKLQIIPEGISGGVTGIQFGVENGTVDASTAMGLRFDMFASLGISKLVFQVVSTSGSGVSTMNSVTTGEWVSVEIPFSGLSETFDSSNLTQLGAQLFGTTSDAIYLDNIYFY